MFVAITDNKVIYVAEIKPLIEHLSLPFFNA